ncbi:MAG: ABC transporter ATP-binding protein [Chloroflexi bacterium]|nr:ABC transporter ATP-binding protein [Chloroflexota bacterium]
MAVIETNDLTRKFGDFTAVNAVNLSVTEGEVFGFLGPNGSGKTTTIRMLLTLLKPSSGTATILGQDTRRASKQFLQQIGYMSQKFSLYTDLSVRENLTFFGRSYKLYGKQLKERMQFALDMAGLKGHENTRTSDLSGGWAQRLALGAAIMHRPRLLFLDEPTAGVDPLSRREFWDLLYNLSQEGTTIFVTTHYMDEAEHCQRLAFIYFGNLIAQGSPEAIIEENVPGTVISFEPDDPIDVLRTVEAAMDSGEVPPGRVSLFGAAVHVVTQDVERMLPFLEAQFANAEGNTPAFYYETPSLEDAFIALVKQADADGQSG